VRPSHTPYIQSCLSGTPKKMPNGIPNPHKLLVQNLIFVLYILLLSTKAFPQRREAVDRRSRFIVHYASKLKATLAMLTGPTGVIRDSAPFHHIPYQRKMFDLFAMTDGWCLEFLRFTKRQICELAWLLALPEHFEGRCYPPATTCLCLVLYRLSWPYRYKDCMEPFGHERSWLSWVFNGTCQHIYRQHYETLQWNPTLLTQARFRYYCQKTQQKGKPSGLISGFVDGTHKQICRPRPETEDQEMFWSGHKHMHSIEFLAVVTPDGIISCIYGPYEGKRGDWGMWKEGMQDMVVENAKDREGDRVYLYGDKALYLEDGIIGAYRQENGIELTHGESVFNAYMAKQRMAVEWGFGKVMQLFQFTNLKSNMKYGLSPISCYYLVSVLLTNCHTCYYGSKTGTTFFCDPPSIISLFQLSEIDKQEFDLYLVQVDHTLNSL